MSSDNKRHYILNIVSTYGTTVVAAILGIVSAPISLNYWKPELYGVWAIVNSFAAYLSISGLGVDIAAGILMTKTNSVREKRAILRKSLILVLAFICVAAVALFLVGRLYPQWVNVIGKMQEATVPVARTTAVIFIVSFLINLPFSTISNSFAAYQKTYLNNTFSFIGNTTQFGVLLAIVSLRLSLIDYALWSAITALLINVVKVVVYRNITRSYISEPSNREEETSGYKQILITGVRLSFYGIAVMLSSNIGNLIISNVFDVSAVAVYSISIRVVSLLMIVIKTINTAMSPLFGKEYASGNWVWIERVYKSLFATTVVLSGLLCYGCMFFLRDVISAWVGRAMDPGMPMVVMLSFWAFTNCLSNTNYVIVNSFNYTKGIVFISWGELIVFALSATVLSRHIGVVGVSAGMFLGALVVTQWALPGIVRKRTAGRLRYDLRLLGEVVVLVLAAIPVMYLQQRFLSAWYWRVFVGVVCVAAYTFLTFRLLPAEFLTRFRLARFCKKE